MERDRRQARQEKFVLEPDADARLVRVGSTGRGKVGVDARVVEALTMRGGGGGGGGGGLGTMIK